MARAFSGAALRDQRRLAGVTASDLANRVGRSPYAIWSYEAGRMRPPVDVAAGLADALEVGLDQLLAGDRTAAAA